MQNWIYRVSIIWLWKALKKEGADIGFYELKRLWYDYQG